MLHLGSNDAPSIRAPLLRRKIVHAFLSAALLAACASPTPPGPAEALDFWRSTAPFLTPAALVPPPPHRDAPAFTPRPDRAPSRSLGAPNAGSLEGGVPLPATHPHLKIRPISIQRGATYGTQRLVTLLERAATHVAQHHPGSLLYAGDLSLEHGGPFSPHASHTNGRDADLAFYMHAGGQPADSDAFRRIPKATLSGFDIPRNWALIEALLTDPDADIQWIFCAHHLRDALLSYAQGTARPELYARAQRTLRQPSDSAPHDDHFHIRIYCDAVERAMGCRDSGPSLPDAHAPALPPAWQPSDAP